MVRGWDLLNVCFGGRSSRQKEGAGRITIWSFYPFFVSGLLLILIPNIDLARLGKNVLSVSLIVAKKNKEGKERKERTLYHFLLPSSYSLQVSPARNGSPMH